MSSLVVLSRSLRMSGGAKELGSEARSVVRLPRVGDAVTALLDGLAVAQHSLVELHMPAARLLDAGEALQDIASAHSRCWSTLQRAGRLENRREGLRKLDISSLP